MKAHKFVAMPQLLKDFPADLKKAVLIKQVEIKSEKKELKASQAHALMEIVREWLELKSKLSI